MCHSKVINVSSNTSDPSMVLPASIYNSESSNCILMIHFYSLVAKQPNRKLALAPFYDLFSPHSTLAHIKLLSTVESDFIIYIHINHHHPTYSQSTCQFLLQSLNPHPTSLVQFKTLIATKPTSKTLKNGSPSWCFSALSNKQISFFITNFTVSVLTFQVCINFVGKQRYCQFLSPCVNVECQLFLNLSVVGFLGWNQTKLYQTNHIHYAL